MTHLLCYIKGIFVQNQREREELADEKCLAFPDHLTPLRTLMAEVGAVAPVTHSTSFKVKSLPGASTHQTQTISEN